MQVRDLALTDSHRGPHRNLHILIFVQDLMTTKTVVTGKLMTIVMIVIAMVIMMDVHCHNNDNDTRRMIIIMTTITNKITTASGAKRKNISWYCARFTRLWMEF